MKMQYQKYQKMQFFIQLYIDIWKIILYLQANPYRLKTKNTNCFINCFISTFIKYIMLMILFCFIGLAF